MGVFFTTASKAIISSGMRAYKLTAAMIPFAGAAATGGKLIKKGVQALGPVVAPVVKNIVKNVAPAVAPAAKKVISTVASVAAPIAKKAISTATTAVKKVVSTATTAVKNTATAAITSVKNAASNFASGVKGLVDGLFKKSAPAPASSKIDLQLFGGKGNIPKRTPDQQALHDLARESVKSAKNGKPITRAEAKILDEWADEYGVPQHHKAYSGSGKHFPGGKYQDHTHIYNEHVPYK